MSLTERDITRRPPRRFKFACPLFILYCNLFSTAASGELPQNYAVRQSQPFQNSRIAHRLLNSPVNHWIEALSHLLHYAIDFAWLSHDQNEQNSERELIVSLSLLDLILASCFRHVCHVIELRRYSRISLFKQCSCLLRFSWQILLAENVFSFKRNYHSFKIFPQF